MNRFKTTLALVLMLIFVTGSAGLAGAPPLPSSFYGTVTLDELDVPEGTRVSAWINGVKYAETSTTLADGDPVYLIDVPGDDPDTTEVEGGREGEIITFEVVDYEAGQTARWFNGTYSRLELAATTGPDLVVTVVNLNAVTTDPQTLIAGGTGKATIKNQGNTDLAADATFTVTFFEDRDGDGAYDSATDNTLGQATHTGGLTSRAEAEVQALVTGEVLFRDNLIYAFVDSGNVVEERNETNNLNHSGNRCEYRPPVGQFNPVLEWEWTGSTILPEFNQVMMIPAVIDLTADGIPDIVFATSTNRNYNTNGHLRAISGRDGSEIFTVTDPDYDVTAVGHVSVGDIDLDGRPEILAVHESPNTILAFEHDGTFKWQSQTIFASYWGTAIAIADLDQEGTPEIVVGATVLNNDGTVRWVGGRGRGDNGSQVAPISLIADLDLEGDPEVVAGNTAYHSDGSVYWYNDSFPDGYNAVGDFDDDPFPEVVLVTRRTWGSPYGVVYLLEHDGTVKWGPAELPTGPYREAGGPPTVADVDGDGEPEIGVAGGNFYNVFETAGTLKWSSPTQDWSSSTTGSSVFDFEGDGSAEIVYGDELKLYIFRGTDGAVLWETSSPSATLTETPVIADVDADGNAEIIMGSNDMWFPGPTGIQVYGDADDTWVPTRRIWNQHTYHITNVNDDGTIPTIETNNWEVYNNYRLNAPPEVLYAPDLTASRQLFDFESQPGSLLVTARIGNGGGLHVAAGVPMAFYDGDPLNSGILLGTVQTTRILNPGGYEDVTFTWPSPPPGDCDIYVVADDDGTGQGTTSECDETNNTHHQLVDTSVIKPDLVVPTMELSGTRTDPQALTITGDVSVQIQNQGSRGVAAPFQVTLFEDTDGDGAFTDGIDDVLGQRTYFGSLAIGQSVWLSVAVNGQVLFRDNLIYAFADSQDVIEELDEDNNVYNSAARCEFGPPVGAFNPVLEWEWTGSDIEPINKQVVMMPLVVDLTGDSVPEVVFQTSTSSTGYGYIRAINGRSGSEIWTNTDVLFGSDLAAGDIDLDGRPEIVGWSATDQQTIALEHDGTFKWLGPAYGVWGGPTIADLDRDGVPEIVVGGKVLNNDGTLRWIGTHTATCIVGLGCNSLVVDLDLVGNPEVIAGRTAYHSDGSIYWHNAGVREGFNAVGNLDADLFPEVVLVTWGKVYLLEHDGAVKWGPKTLDKRDDCPALCNNYGGPPAIADVDGDGDREITVAGGCQFFVFEADGAVKWKSATQDCTSGFTGSTVFDLEGDGSPEVIYSDELMLRIYNGADGTVRWQTQSPNATLSEYPVVADVDADGSAEIVVGNANYPAAFPGPTGIQVYGDANDTWMPTRQIWNQHTYHVTNVNDDGTIPSFEINNWELYNNYRVNVPPARFRPPDITASRLLFDDSAMPDVLQITARIGSAGADVVEAGLPVAFYSGDPADGGILLGTVQTTQDLDPGEYEEVTFIWNTPPLGLQTIYVAANDNGTGQGPVDECDETNNIHWRQYITGPEGPDLLVPLVDASGTSTDPHTLTIQGTVTAQVKNQGTTAAGDDFDVTFFEDVDGDETYSPGVDNVLGQVTHTGGLAPGVTVTVEAFVGGQVQFLGSPLWAFADSGDVIAELDETNNLNHTATQCQVSGAPAPDLALSYLRGEPVASVDLTVRVGNAGAAAVAPGVGVDFYLGDPAAGGTLLDSTATVSNLRSGAFEDVTIRWTDETTGTHDVLVTVDAVGECHEANNIYQQQVDILDISLVESWNLISGWVNPHNTNIGVVQRPISGAYVVILGFDQGGQSYYPDVPLEVNTLKEVDAEHGYWVKVKRGREQGSRGAVAALHNLRLVGTAFPENRELALDSDWNLVSFLSRTQMGVVEGLRSVDEEYTAVLGFKEGALSYYPHLPAGFSTLSTLDPLSGYWIRMSHEATLRYPRTQPGDTGATGLTGGDPDAEHRAHLARQAEQATGVQPTNTWGNFYGLAASVDGEPVPVGALVQVFDTDRVPCGAGMVTEPGQYGLLACYGDDSTTDEDEGASPGDVLTFTINGQPATVNREAVWTAHGDLIEVNLETEAVTRLWQVYLPLVRKGDK